MSLAVGGHGALIQIELDPDSAPGQFTTVAELNGDVSEPGLNRPETEVTPHQDTIDSYVHGRLGRDPLTFSVNYVFDDPTHDANTGLQKHIIDNKRFGVRILGPGGSANTDEIIASGKVSSFRATNPVREGARTAEVTIRFSKQFKKDGVLVGTAV